METVSVDPKTRATERSAEKMVSDVMYGRVETPTDGVALAIADHYYRIEPFGSFVRTGRVNVNDLIRACETERGSVTTGDADEELCVLIVWAESKAN